MAAFQRSQALQGADHGQADAVADHIYHSTGFKYNTTTIRQDYPQIFNWLDLQNINVIIIITLIIAVTGVSMVSTLLIIIMNRAGMIGLLKALGARNAAIRNIFIRLSLPIIGKGIAIGNGIGIALCLLQLKFQFIGLSQESYYVSSVPVNLSLINLLLMNAGAIVAGIIILIGPSMIIARMSPAKSIRMN